MKLLSIILCLFAPFYVISALSLDGLTLLSLLKHWTSVPPSLNSSWKSSDSSPCSWPGIQCDYHKNVVFLNLTASQISGNIGPEIGQLTHLQKLLLAKNGFSGTIPPELGNCSMLDYIDLSENHLLGNIPPAIGNCKSLKSLLLYSNQLEGAIPNELGKLSKLEDLELYFNRLTGEIPHAIWKIQGLKHVLLHNNSLSGKLPSEVTELRHLKNISLFDNRFSGTIPQSLRINISLVKLELMNNMFTGYIPPNLSFGKHLQTLNLCPSTFKALSILGSLDLSRTNLSVCTQLLGNLQLLIKVNISYNLFSGSIPHQIMHQPESSFLGNPSISVNYSTLDHSSHVKFCNLKPCEHVGQKKKSSDQKGSKKPSLLELGLMVFVISLSCVIWLTSVIYLSSVIYIRWLVQTSNVEANVDYEDKEALFSNDEGCFRCINLLEAAEHLHDEYIIGEGGHGIVYKAKLDIGVFAIKKVEFAKRNRRKSNMIREIEMTRKIRHKNVARCLGSWIGGDYGLIVSRYMENGSLHDVLHGNNRLPCLGWNVRYKIAIGIAKGLAYLHHDHDPPILHRDIKPKNILLDSDMQPCITDFGISIALNQPSATIHLLSTYHLGTRGFMAPEIAYVVVPSCELDVYSYGVVLLELITRKKVLDFSFVEEETTLVGWFKSVWRRTNELEEIIDSSLVRELSDLNAKVQIIKVLLMALTCTEADPGKRLKMRDVVEFFETPTDPGKNCVRLQQRPLLVFCRKRRSVKGKL